jgi:hypothetical protein
LGDFITNTSGRPVGNSETYRTKRRLKLDSVIIEMSRRDQDIHVPFFGPLRKHWKLEAYPDLFDLYRVFFQTQLPNHESSILRPGADVMIFKNIFVEKIGEKVGVFLLKSKLNCAKI